MEYNNTGKSDITGNRDASYSLWHRRTLCRKHTNIDNDLLELSNQHVYTLYYNFDKEGDLLPKVILETKGLIYKEEIDKYILPDLTPHYHQIRALRGTAKVQNIPALMVFYYISEGETFFVAIPLNNAAKTYIPAPYKAMKFSEIEYVKFLYKICEINETAIGKKESPKMNRFLYQKFYNSLLNLP